MPGSTVFRFRIWCLLALVATGSGTFCQAQNDDGPPPLSGEPVNIVGSTTNLEIPERFAKVVAFAKRVVRVDGFDPGVVSVTALTPQQIRIQAMAQGVTTVVVTDEDANVFTLEIFVTGDARLLQAVLDRTYPNTAVHAMDVKGSVLLRGWVSEPTQINEIVALAQLYYPQVLNQMRVAGAQEVQLHVKVMEVQRSLTRRMGLNWTYFNDNAAIISVPGPIAGLSALAVPLGGPPAGTLAATGLQNASMAFGYADSSNAFTALLDALKQEGLLKLHAETTLVTRSGEAARLSNGGQFPIPVPQSLGTVTIQWKEFGVILESLPLIISPTRLKQAVTVEVSERDLTSAVTLNGTTVPGLNQRKVETQVEMNFGETLVIGGLIFTRYTSATNKIPFLGELPGIGAAFRRLNYTEAETELIVLITPEFVSAMAPEQVPPGGPGLQTDIPTDRELYLQGVPEVPLYGPRCSPGNCPPGFDGSSGFCPPGTAPNGMMPEVAPGPGTAPLSDPGMPQAPAVPSAGPTLIGPPGTAPGIPASEPLTSRQGSNRTTWPSTSSASQLSQSKKVTTSANRVQAAGYQSEAETGSRKNTGVSQAGGNRPWSPPSTR